MYASLQAGGGGTPPAPPATGASSPPAAPSAAASLSPGRPSAGAMPSNPGPSRESTTLTLEEPATSPADNARFRVDKTGYETDIFDRRAMRNLIRAGDLDENDRVKVDDAPPVPAGEVGFLKSFFALRKTSRIQPPTCCRTHTDRVAHFKCRDTGRPLCEECSPEKKFGATIIRVCSHCGGTASELVSPVA